MILNFANASVRLLLDARCAACDDVLDRPLDGPVCEACWRGVAALTPPWCVQCGDALPRGQPSHCPRCLRAPPAFAVARSAGQYHGSLRHIIHAFKYERRRVLARRLAEMMTRAGADLIDAADAVVPVPLHPWRAFARGFNQADDLARHLGRPVCRALRRRRHGPPQAGLTAARRVANVHGAYGLRRTPGARRAVHGKILILVDDVMTTGATVEACAAVLMEAGARKVLAVTAARAAAAQHASPLPPLDLSFDRRR